jgi:hypothetical protein
MFLDTLCDLILDVNKNIQSVVLVNKQGRAVEKISRPEFTRQFPDFINEMFLMSSILQVSLGRDFDEQYGPINYHISGRENLTILSLPVHDHVILAAVNKNVSPISLVRKIVNVINNRQKQPHEIDNSEIILQE